MPNWNPEAGRQFAKKVPSSISLQKTGPYVTGKEVLPNGAVSVRSLGQLTVGALLSTV